MLGREHSDTVIKVHADLVGILGPITRNDLMAKMQLMPPHGVR